MAVTAETEDFSVDEEDNTEENTEDNIQGETPEDSSVILQFAITTEGECTAANLVVAAPATGGTPVIVVNVTDGTYTGAVSWNPGNEITTPKRMMH